MSLENAHLTVPEDMQEKLQMFYELKLADDDWYTIDNTHVMDIFFNKVERPITTDVFNGFAMCIVNGNIPVLAEFLAETGFRRPMAFHFAKPHPEVKGGILYKIYSIRDINEALGMQKELSGHKVNPTLFNTNGRHTTRIRPDNDR